MNAFSCGEEIFEPLEKIDMRFKLEDMYKSDYAEEDYNQNSSFTTKTMKKSVHKVMEALEGEVELQPRKANISAFKHSLMYKEYPSASTQ